MMGTYFDLRDGDNVIGRDPACEVVIDYNKISKKHARISVQGDHCVITDLGSSNGTFVNGVKVQTRVLRPGDRIAFHDLIVELARPASSPTRTNYSAPPAAPSPAQSWGTNVAYNTMPPPPAPAPTAAPMDGLPQPVGDAAQNYVSKVIMPGIYKLNESYPTKTLIGFFISIFALLVTSLASIPMAELTRVGVQKEAQRRAITLARQLSQIADKAINSGSEAAIRTDFFESQDGVLVALVVAKDDGHIIAPITRANSYSNDEFVARARKQDQEYVHQITDTTIGVSVPIRSYNAEAGGTTTSALSIILYKMDTVDLNATVGVFARVLVISLIVGFVIFFLIYRLVAQPIEEATLQIDEMLRGNRELLSTPYEFEIFKKLLGDVTTALTRPQNATAFGTQTSMPSADRSQEATNLVRILSDAAFALDGRRTFIQVNGKFEELTGMRQLTLQGQGLEILTDQSLKLNLEDLLQSATTQPGQIVTGSLDFNGQDYEIDVQGFLDGSAISFYFGVLKVRQG